MSVELLDDTTKFLNSPSLIENINSPYFINQSDSMKIIDENFGVYKRNKDIMRQILPQLRGNPLVISEELLTHTIFTLDALDNIRNELKKIKSHMHGKIDFDFARFLKAIEYELVGCQVIHKTQITIHAEKSLLSGFSEEKLLDN